MSNLISNRNLKVFFAIRDKKINGCILWQTPYFNSSSKRSFEPDFSASNGMTIASASTPELTRSHFYLRGSATDTDFGVFHREFESNEARDKYFNKLVQALTEWSAEIDRLMEQSKFTSSFEEIDSLTLTF